MAPRPPQGRLGAAERPGRHVRAQDPSPASGLLAANVGMNPLGGKAPSVIILYRLCLPRAWAEV
jgi:hypothetical protein